MPSGNVELVQRGIAAYNRRDLDTLRDVNDPDVELDWSASRGLDAGVYRGSDEVIGFYENFLETFENVHFDPDRFIESGDRVVVPNVTRVRGRDGVETAARSAFVFEVRDGRIASIRLYQETREALEAVGLRE